MATIPKRFEEILEEQNINKTAFEIEMPSIDISKYTDDGESSIKPITNSGEQPAQSGVNINYQPPRPPKPPKAPPITEPEPEPNKTKSITEPEPVSSERYRKTRSLNLDIEVPRDILSVSTPGMPRRSSSLIELIKEDNFHVARRNDEYGFVEIKKPSAKTTWE